MSSSASRDVVFAGGAAAAAAGASLIRGRHILTRKLDERVVETLDDSAVLQVDGRIAAIGPFAELRRQHPDLDVVGDEHALVIPGLVDAHHHVGITPIQLGSPDLPLELWLTHQMRHRAPDAYLDTLYSAFELVASGVTAVQHLGRMQPPPIADWAATGRAVIEAYRDIGMRLSYASCTRDQHRLVYADDEVFIARLPTDLQDETRAFLRRSHFRLDDFATDYLQPMIDQYGAPDPLVRLWLASINLERASDRMLAMTSAWAAEHGVGIHLHMDETIYQKAFSLRRFGQSSVAHLAEIGFLGSHVTLGHGTWIEEADFEHLHAHGVCICHNASSNLRLRSGIAPVNEFVRRGIPVALGIDEAGLNDDRDMLQEMRLVKHLHCTPGLDEVPLTPAQIFHMATSAGARATGFGDAIGSIEVGKRADLVVLDYRAMTAPHVGAAMQPVDVLIHRAKSAHVQATMIEGRVVYRDGRFAYVDRDAVFRRLAEALSQPETAGEAERRRLSDALLPHQKSFYDGWQLPFGEPWYRLNGR